MLAPEELAELREALLASRRELLERAGLPAAPEGHDPGDAQDFATEEQQMRDALAVSNRDESHLAEVDAALARMAAGTYGICEETGEPIPLARLRAQPTTRYTVEALELLEEERSRDALKASDRSTEGY